jgi:hypothetical protein
LKTGQYISTIENIFDPEFNPWLWWGWRTESELLTHGRAECRASLNRTRYGLRPPRSS